MRAMILRSPGLPLERSEIASPTPNEDELLVVVECCAVCRTDLHVADGELADPKLPLPLVRGHQIVGRDVAAGARVGIPSLGWTCAACRFCLAGEENLRDRAQFTGYTRDGGFAEYVANDALRDLRAGELTGPAILEVR